MNKYSVIVLMCLLNATIGHAQNVVISGRLIIDSERTSARSESSDLPFVQVDEQRTSGGVVTLHEVSPFWEPVPPVEVQTRPGESLSDVISRGLAQLSSHQSASGTWTLHENGWNNPARVSDLAITSSDPALDNVPHPEGLSGFYDPQVDRYRICWTMYDNINSEHQVAVLAAFWGDLHLERSALSNSGNDRTRVMMSAWCKGTGQGHIPPESTTVHMYVSARQAGNGRSSAHQALYAAGCMMEDRYISTPIAGLFSSYMLVASEDAQEADNWLSIIQDAAELNRLYREAPYVRADDGRFVRDTSHLPKMDARTRHRNRYQLITVGTGAVGVYRPAVGLRAGGPYHASFLVEMPEAPPARADWSVEVVLLMAPFEDLDDLMQRYLDHEERTFADGRPGHIEPIWRRDASTPYNPGWQSVSTRDVPAYAQTDGIPLPPGVEALALAVVGRNLGRAPIGIDFFTLTDGTCERLMGEGAVAAEH